MLRSVIVIFLVTLEPFRAEEEESRSFAVDDSGALHYIPLSTWNGSASDAVDNDAALKMSEFRLYTRFDNVSHGVRIERPSSFEEGHFRYDTRTWFIIHGWLGSSESAHLVNIKNTVLQQFNHNVVMVDWAAVANGSYWSARWGMVTIAARLSELINHLATNRRYGTGNITLVGFSLGAHMAGVAAHGVIGGFKGYIVGLDPASAMFRSKDLAGRLDRTDAAYVEVVHSNGGLAGYLSPMGHADFYLNGGVLQPECGTKIFYCSHSKAMEVYELSLRARVYGVRCSKLQTALYGRCSDRDGTARLGGYVPKDWTGGIFYVKT